MTMNNPAIEALKKALSGVMDVTNSEWDGGDPTKDIPNQSETIDLIESAIAMLTPAPAVGVKPPRCQIHDVNNACQKTDYGSNRWFCPDCLETASGVPPKAIELLEKIADGYGSDADMAKEALAALSAVDVPADDIKRLVRELDVLLNGEDCAAKQASLCDIVAQVKSDKWRLVQSSALAGAKALLSELDHEATLPDPVGKTYRLGVIMRNYELTVRQLIEASNG